MVSRLEVTMLESAHPLNQPEIGKLIRELRLLMGRTQEQFAVVLGVSFSTLNRWEKGHIHPSPLALRQVYAVLSQLSQASTPELQEGAKALVEKYLSDRQPT